MNTKPLLFLALLVGSHTATANEWIVTEGSGQKGVATFTVGFAGDGAVTDASVDLSYDAQAFAAKVSGLNGGSCTIHPDGGVVRVITPIADASLSKAVVALCQVSLAAVGSKAGSKASLSPANADCFRGTPERAECDLSSADVAK